jgi:hypothetical protein
MGRVAHARDQLTVAQKKISELWQWIAGREEMPNVKIIGEAQRCDDTIAQLKVVIHDLEIVRDELIRADR